MSAEVLLTEAEREAALRAHVHISPRDLIAAIESILTARLAAAEAERDEAQGLAGALTDELGVSAARYADLRAGITAVVGKWRSEDDMSEWGSHDKTFCAMALEALLDTTGGDA